MIRSILLDHVAVAFHRRADAWARYGGDLPGRYLAGGTGPGFANYQLDYGGMRLEVLEPAGLESNDFLARFLVRSGPGPHHLTFKVEDIHAAIAAVSDAGYHPVGVRTDFPRWKEMFLHPREIPGIVVQLAESHGEFPAAEPPAGFPARRTDADAVLEAIVHGVPDLGEAVRLFAGLLGGSDEGHGEDELGRWTDLTWERGGRLRLVTPLSPASLLAGWIGERTGRLHHLAFRTADPGALADAVPVEGLDVPTWEVPPERNSGTRLRLVRSP